MVQKSDKIFHLHKFIHIELCGTESAIAKAKWFSGKVATDEIHRSYPFSHKANKSYSMASILAVVMCVSSSHLSTS